MTAAASVAVAVGLARLCHGLHHPTDVVAGASLAVACLAVALIAARPVRPGRQQ